MEVNILLHHELNFLLTFEKNFVKVLIKLLERLKHMSVQESGKKFATGYSEN